MRTGNPSGYIRKLNHPFQKLTSAPTCIPDPVGPVFEWLCDFKSGSSCFLFVPQRRKPINRHKIAGFMLLVEKEKMTLPLTISKIRQATQLFFRPHIVIHALTGFQDHESDHIRNILHITLAFVSMLILRVPVCIPPAHSPPDVFKKASVSIFFFDLCLCYGTQSIIMAIQNIGNCLCCR